MTEVVDSHVHIWGPQIASLDWLLGSGLPDEVGLDRVCGGHRVILVTADAVGQEAEREAQYFSRLSVTDPRVYGFVAGINLTRGDVAFAVSKLRSLPGLVGVRHNLQDVIGSLEIDQLTRSLGLLADADIAFDACVRHHELATLNDLIERVPTLRVVLDHMGKPPVDDRHLMTQWRCQIGRLAARSQTWCKLSGLAAECDSPSELETEAPHVLEACLSAFGPERCMFGSDQPISVDPHWLDRIRAATDSGDQQLVLHDVATNFYRSPQ